MSGAFQRNQRIPRLDGMNEVQKLLVVFYPIAQSYPLASGRAR